MGNPGAYVAEMDERLLEKMRTIKEFNAALRDSMTRVKQIKRKFDGNPSPQWLLDLLRQRAALDLPQRIFARDHILEIACGRLAILRDTDALMQAAELTNDWYARDALARGLGTPDGREALLSVIADTGQSTERRTLFAMLLRRVGVVYSEINADRGTPKGEPKAGNAAYMTRIAQLALDSAKREPLSLALIEAVRSGAEQCGFTENRDLHSDCLDALELLKSLHSTTRSEEIKFAIEIATRTYSKEAYEKLESPCGPVISIVRPPSPTQGLPPGERGLLVGYQANIWPGDEAEYETEAVFEHVASGSQFTSPCPHMGPLRNGGCGGGMAIPLPKGLEEGACRVRLQFRRDGKVVSTGHYLEAEL